jgi:hypothetical protein
MTEKSRLLDAYDIKARLIPAALCVLPVLVLYHYLLQTQFNGLFNELSHVRFLGYLTIEAAGTYLIMQLNNRLGGKLLQGFVFNNGQTMPTTQILMPEDVTLSTQTKREIVAKFKHDFHKDLPLFSKGVSDSDRRKRIGELVAYVRNATRGDMLVKNHNVEYGFVRNLCGGSFGATVFCGINVVIFSLLTWSRQGLVISAALLAIYGIVALLSKPLIKFFGTNYATVLFEQYLSQRFK